MKNWKTEVNRARGINCPNLARLWAPEYQNSDTRLWSNKVAKPRANNSKPRAVSHSSFSPRIALPQSLVSLSLLCRSSNNLASRSTPLTDPPWLPLCRWDGRETRSVGLPSFLCWARLGSVRSRVISPLPFRLHDWRVSLCRYGPQWARRGRRQGRAPGDGPLPRVPASHACLHFPAVRWELYSFFFRTQFRCDEEWVRGSWSLRRGIGRAVRTKEWYVNTLW
jgi:hypothetical protein